MYSSRWINVKNEKVAPLELRKVRSKTWTEFALIQDCSSRTAGTKFHDKTLPDLHITPPTLTQNHFIQSVCRSSFDCPRIPPCTTLCHRGKVDIKIPVSLHYHQPTRNELFVNKFILLRMSIGQVRDDEMSIDTRVIITCVQWIVETMFASLT